MNDMVANGIDLWTILLKIPYAVALRLFYLLLHDINVF